jgi:hypothetical protein
MYTSAAGQNRLSLPPAVIVHRLSGVPYKLSKGTGSVNDDTNLDDHAKKQQHVDPSRSCYFTCLSID